MLPLETSSAHSFLHYLQESSCLQNMAEWMLLETPATKQIQRVTRGKGCLRDTQPRGTGSHLGSSVAYNDRMGSQVVLKHPCANG